MQKRPKHIPRLLCILLFAVSSLWGGTGAAQGDDFDAEWAALEKEVTFDDTILQEALKHPTWFRLTFLDLNEDLQEALNNDKRGLIVYFGQKFCPYCQKLMEVNFGKRDIAEYTQKNFDVIAIDIFGDRAVTLFNGKEVSEKEYTELEETNFTPSLVFYVKDGEEALRLRGYYPPYQFRAALEYVADGHHRNETFREFLERADPTMMDLDEEGMNTADFFIAPPYHLERTRFHADRPLAVFFEQGDCHACDVLHSGPLQTEELQALIGGLDAVQLNMWADTPVVTPGGAHTTAKAWAEKLGLFYTPTLIFFDEKGHEIIRVDSVAHFYRLRRALNYVMSGAYKQGTTLQQWLRQAGSQP